MAIVRRRLGTAATEQRVSASLPSLSAPSLRASFTANAEPGPPVQAILTTSTGLIMEIGVPVMIHVKVRDEFGNGVPGTTVDWQVVEGAGDLGSSSTQSDAQGRASTELIPRQLGTLDVEAVVGGNVIAERSFAAVAHRAVDLRADNLNPPDGRIAPDLLALGASIANGGLHVHLEFTQELVADGSGAPNEVLGALDLDIDRDPATGFSGFAESLSSGISMCDEVVVDMATNASGEYRVWRQVAGGLDFEVAGTVTPRFSDRLLEFVIPLGLIGDPQAPFNIAVLVGTPEGPGSQARVSSTLLNDAGTVAVTDVGPGSAALTVDAPAGAGSG